MNRRKIGIQIIVCDVAENGIAGKTSVRAYVETRMSRQTFNEAISIGQNIYDRRSK